MNKLEGFPSVYYISLEESVERRIHLENQFKNNGIVNYTPLIFKRFKECNDIIHGPYVHTLRTNNKGASTSHLKAIRKWLNETNEPYAVFFEDDVSFETVKYWNFTWKDFVKNLPDDWEAVQLMWVRSEMTNIKFRERYFDDWSATAFMINREYGQRLLDKFVIGEEEFNYDMGNLQPIVENIIYTSGKVYTAPLFVEEIDLLSTFMNAPDFDPERIVDGQEENHLISRSVVLNWWKNNSETSFETLMEKKLNVNRSLLERYAYDTENPEKNFNLANWYFQQNQTAAAITFYLRAADRTEDLTLAYECLLQLAVCFSRQSNRDNSVKGLYQHAITVLPKRPEAYYFLAQFYEWRKEYSECYTTCSIALNVCDFNSTPLSTDVGYVGKYGLIFQKAVSSYWWGKSKECRELFLELKNNYNDVMDEVHRTSVKDNLKLLKIDTDFNYSSDFDWGELSYEDKITIEREIVNEKVYRFWEDVKENDIVVDVGASVGAYTVSILDQKPSKVYCIEPSKNLLKTLIKNCSEKIINLEKNPIVCVNYGIVDNDEEINIFGNNKEFKAITFKKFIEDYSISGIDFMKIDCEGGEYSIFKKENMNFLLNNVKFIAMEIHLNYKGCREKFKHFRNNYLINFKNYKVMSCTRQNIIWGKSLDIKDKIFDDNFIDNYSCEFMIYINNT